MCAWISDICYHDTPEKEIQNFEPGEELSAELVVVQQCPRHSLTTTISTSVLYGLLGELNDHFMQILRLVLTSTTPKSGSVPNDGPLVGPEWLNTLLPGSIIFAAFILDILWTLPWPAPFQFAWKWISSPFRNFLTIDDLLEPVDRSPSDAKFKNRCLAGLAFVSFLEWVGCIVFGVIMKDSNFMIMALVYSVSWVSRLDA